MSVRGVNTSFIPKLKKEKRLVSDSILRIFNNLCRKSVKFINYNLIV